MKLVSDNTNKMMRANIRSLTAGGENDFTPANNSNWNLSSLISRFEGQASAYPLNESTYIRNASILAFQDLATMAYDGNLHALGAFSADTETTRDLHAMLQDTMDRMSLRGSDLEAFRLMAIATKQEDLTQQASVMINYLTDKLDQAYFQIEERADALAAYIKSGKNDVSILPNTSRPAANDQKYAYTRSA